LMAATGTTVVRPRIRQKKFLSRQIPA